MPERETKCAAVDLPTPCNHVVRWMTLSAVGDPTGVAPEALGPMREAGWECVLGSWFCSLHKDMGTLLIVARAKDQAAVLAEGGKS